MEYNEIDWNGTEKIGIERNGIDRNGIDTNGIERNGIERNGIETNGIERSNNICCSIRKVIFFVFNTSNVVFLMLVLLISFMTCKSYFYYLFDILCLFLSIIVIESFLQFTKK